MNIRDHKNLALSLLRTESEKRHISCLRKAAFLLGNMEPDMNLISYFRDFSAIRGCGGTITGMSAGVCADCCTG